MIFCLISKKRDAFSANCDFLNLLGVFSVSFMKVRRKVEMLLKPLS